MVPVSPQTTNRPYHCPVSFLQKSPSFGKEGLGVVLFIHFSEVTLIISDFMIRSHLELALFMVSDQYTGHKTTKPHLVYTGDRFFFVAVYEN